MAKHTDQNQHNKHSGHRNKAHNFVAAFTAVIFVLGAGMFVFNKFIHKPVRLSETVTSASDIPGWWNKQYFGSSVCDKDNCKSDADPDDDKLNNAQEFFYHTNPMVAFTVNDKLNDGQLVAAGFDPSREGHVAFDAVGTEDSILGESLVFNSDIKQLINESVNPNAVVLPLLQDTELKIINENSEVTIRAYLENTSKAMAKYFPKKDVQQFISDAIASTDAVRIADVKDRLIKASNDLKQIPTPTDFLQMHKYMIALFQVLPNVIEVPPNDQLADESNSASNIWFDQTQIAMTLYQKISLEQTRLENKY